MSQMNEMCDIFIMFFVLFLFVTCFGWNFNAIVGVEEEEGGRAEEEEGVQRKRREGVEEDGGREGGGGGR